MPYPTNSEYRRAVQDADNFDQLSYLEPVLDSYGEPLRSSGAFAVVFKMRDTKTGRYYALKCFTEEQVGREEAYRMIADELAMSDSPYLLKVRYLDKELFVDSAVTDQTEFPVLLMDWADGDTLEHYIQEHYRDTRAMASLCQRFCRMAAWLRSQTLAHGDIKPDNIMVRPDGSLVLVDYDGMFVPAMKGRRSPTVGTRDFAHPSRTADLFDETIDDFSLASMALSLRAIALQPQLLDDYGAPDRLLFSADDYRQPAQSRALQALYPLLADPDLCRLYGLFLMALSQGDLQQVSFRAFNISKTNPPVPPVTAKPADEIFNVGGVQFKMVYVEGGTFMMGSTSEQDSDVYDDEKPAHSVTLNNYYIGETEVTQALWKAVMGSNPSNWKGDNLPVETVSWKDCQEFIKKLNNLIGKTFRLPTEAEWEYAARGGNKSRGYKYAGSDNIGIVAWYDGNSGSKTHPVKGKAANELGLYDMSGNVWEWCDDWYGDYSSSFQRDPIGESTGSGRVIRGGCWSCRTRDCRVSLRSHFDTSFCYYHLGLRLVLDTESVTPTIVPNPSTPLADEIFTVGGVQFKMVYVEGGTFVMGATPEQGDDAMEREKPAHSVTLDGYFIGETAVTQALWKAVMGSNPSNWKGDNLPVETVFWEDCQEFIQKLNNLTGKTFRLPTEAEWEYAARGGNKSRGYKYAGSDNIDSVAWYGGNSDRKTHPVKGKNSNELGLYDMTGNVWEWCQDRYGAYDSTAQKNPTGASAGSDRVGRGGGWFSDARRCRVSNRYGINPLIRGYDLGLRLVLVP